MKLELRGTTHEGEMQKKAFQAMKTQFTEAGKGLACTSNRKESYAGQASKFEGVWYGDNV